MSLASRALKDQAYSQRHGVKRSKQDIELALLWLDGSVTTAACMRVKKFRSTGHFNSWVGLTLREARRRSEL